MKAVGLIFLTLGCATWTFGAAYPAQSVAASQQVYSRSAADTVDNHSHEADHAAPADAETHAGKPSDVLQNRRMDSGHKPPASNPSADEPNGRNGPMNGRERSVSEDSKNSHRPASDKSAGAAQNGLARNEAVNRAPSNRASGAVWPAESSLSNVRHRGPNPPIVGGTGNSSTRNTGVLDGTHMNRKRTRN